MTDQCLAETLALATWESEEREGKMVQEIERLLSYHDRANTQTMINLESRLDAKAEFLMQKLDEFLTSNYQNSPSDKGEKSR